MVISSKTNINRHIISCRYITNPYINSTTLKLFLANRLVINNFLTKERLNNLKRFPNVNARFYCSTYKGIVVIIIILFLYNNYISTRLRVEKDYY